MVSIFPFDCTNITICRKLPRVTKADPDL